MNIDYWQDRLNESLQKARQAQSARTCAAYLELAAYYRSMVELAHRNENLRGMPSKGLEVAVRRPALVNLSNAASSPAHRSLTRPPRSLNAR